MVTQKGKYENKKKQKLGWSYGLVPLTVFLMEVFAFRFLQVPDAAGISALWPLGFGVLWTLLLGGLLYLLPWRISRIGYGILFGISVVYAVGQTGYYQLFSEMMWLSEFRYATEGADYLDVLLSYPLDWYVWILGLLILGVLLILHYPRISGGWLPKGISVLCMALAAVGMLLFPQKVFERDSEIRYAKSDYGRMQSAQAAYENMFHPHRLYQICGMYHMMAKDVYSNGIYPLTPAFREEKEAGVKRVEQYLGEKESRPNEMTGLLRDKNVILVLMESMDDWMIGEHTPTIARLMAEGINFTNFYTPPYGGIRTFNTEFCINTGSFLSSQGGYAFDYVTNSYHQSLAALLTERGYSAKTFHYNDPSFYSRDIFSEAMGYEDYVYYEDYLTEYTEKERKQLLYDEKILLTEPDLRQEFFREGKTLNFLITRSAHLSYKYNEVLSHWALKQYPQYRGMTGSEETDCALVKARLVDDLFQQLLTELEKEGKLADTVIVGITDHYTYGYKNEEQLMELSAVEHNLLLEKTPCFIWSSDMAPMEVSKTLNTADFLPTMLNLLGVETEYRYIGNDAFDEIYEGYVLFSNGSWISQGNAYDAATGKILSLTGNSDPLTKETREKMDQLADDFTTVNNLILETDYYA